MKKILALLLLTSSLPAQDAPENALAKKCDSEIKWITDGTVLVDAEQLGQRPKNYKVDRAALLEEAKKQAAEKKRLILWYCIRVPGTHMNRAEVVDGYMKAMVFTDPDVVALINDKFVPLRMCCDAETSQSTGVKKFDFVEPGFIFMNAEGTILHTIDRIRTFNADWVYSALVAALRKFDAAHVPEEGTTPEAKAAELRRAGKFEDALKLDVPIEKARSLIALERFDEARKILETLDSAESEFFQGVIDAWTGKDPEPRWRALVDKRPATRWAWRAAAELVHGFDTLRDGAMGHNFGDFFGVADAGLPASTRRPAKDVETAAARAVRFLLRAQREDGSWYDSRYVYCNTPKILPNVVTAMTALAAMALWDWRDVDPKRCDAAIKRAEKYILDDTHINLGENEECYAQSYRLMYLARKKDVKRMNEVVRNLVAIQKKNGFWAHEYPNPFATGAAVHALMLAKKAGATVEEVVLKRAADGLVKTRGDGGRQAYMSGPASSARNSMARSAMCELALYECGVKTLDDVAVAVDSYWKFLDKLEAVRVCDYHADQELGGFFFFHGVFHTCEAATALPEAKRNEYLRKFREQMLSIPEFDGSYLDSHELGKSYGTAMALLVLSRSATK